MGVRKRYKLWSDDGRVLVEIEDLRGTPGGSQIAMQIIDLNAPEGWPDEEASTYLDLTVGDARQLVAILRMMLGEISETQLVELLED